MYQAHGFVRAQDASSVVFPHPGPATTVVSRRPSAPSSTASSSGRATQSPGSDGGTLRRGVTIRAGAITPVAAIAVAHLRRTCGRVRPHLTVRLPS